MADRFGIYIKTFKPDHYLAKVLVASIRHFAPGIEIMLVPDDGYAADTLWGVPVLNSADPFLLSLKGYYKKFWVFYGPFDRFIYTDADALVLRPVSPLIDATLARSKPFFLACAETKTVRAVKEAAGKQKDRLYGNFLGDLGRVGEFDPSYAFREAWPVPSGFFASHRDFIALEDLREVMARLAAFHRERNLPELTGKHRGGVFNADQGVLNYLLYRRGVCPELLHDVFVWGAKAIPPDDGTNPLHHMFVHWAGCPRPNFTARNVPAGSEWLRFYREYYKERPAIDFWLDTAGNIWDDLRSRVRRRLSRLKRAVIARST